MKQDLVTLSLRAAEIALAATMARAQSAGERVAVAVVGRNGELRTFASMDGAFTLATQIAQDKAYTVTVAGGAPTLRLQEVVAGDAVIDRIFRVDPRVMAIGGGIPILVDGQLAGAIGVSGAPTAERDDELAQAGADAVARSTETG